MKHFIITIDTEGDNLWQWDKKSPITTENTLYLPRFQKLCEEYGFKPVWLTNYEMINDPRYVDFIMDVEERKVGELGMHLHAWNTPPHHDLPVVQTGLPYLIEYPEDVMRAKVETMTNLIKEKTGIQPTSHRAGRWAMDDRYFKILKEFGYTVDCSVTPHINWQSSPGQTEVNGTDFSDYPEKPYWVDEDKTLLEVPVSVKKTKAFIKADNFTIKNFARSCKRTLYGQTLWLRPNGFNNNALLYFLDKVANSDAEYILFMLHSSEFMPGGSPTFVGKSNIEGLFQTLDKVFKNAIKYYDGITLRRYYSNKIDVK